MARVALTTFDLVATGTDLSTKYVTIGVDGVAIDNSDGKAAVIIYNSGGVSTTITIDVPVNVDTDLVIPDRTYTINAGEIFIIKPFAKAPYNQDDSGDSGLENAVLIDSSQTTGVSIAAFNAPKA